MEYIELQLGIVVSQSVQHHRETGKLNSADVPVVELSRGYDSNVYACSLSLGTSSTTVRPAPRERSNKASRRPAEDPQNRVAGT